MTAGDVWAHVDESYPRTAPGRFLYALASVITTAQQRVVAAETLRGAAKRDGLSFLHFADEDAHGQVGMAKLVADLEITGSVVVAQASAQQKLEACRSRLLSHATLDLHRVEQVNHLVIESRHQADKNDRHTVQVLRAKHGLRSDEIYVDFRRKSTDPILWIADCIASAFTTAYRERDPEPWAILNETHVIDVHHL